MRTRSISVPAVTGTHRNYRNGVQQSNFANTVMSSFSSTMVDVSTPMFRKKQKEGEIIINPCSMTVTQRTTSGSGSVTQVQNVSPFTVWTANGTGTITGYYDKYGGGLPTYTEAPLPDLSQAISMAKQQCLANVDSTPFSFAEDIAEFRETLRFLRDPLASIRTLSFNYRKAVERIKKGKKFSSKKSYSRQLAEDLSGVWLEQRFAVMPIFRQFSN